MELQKGRPENTDNRLDKEIRVLEFNISVLTMRLL